MRTYWLHKTNAGRIVYNRKKHVFSFRDLFRITNSLSSWEPVQGIKFQEDITDLMRAWLLMPVVGRELVLKCLKFYEMTPGLEVELFRTFRAGFLEWERLMQSFKQYRLYETFEHLFGLIVGGEQVMEVISTGIPETPVEKTTPAIRKRETQKKRGR